MHANQITVPFLHNCWIKKNNVLYIETWSYNDPSFSFDSWSYLIDDITMNGHQILYEILKITVLLSSYRFFLPKKFILTQGGRTWRHQSFEILKSYRILLYDKNVIFQTCADSLHSSISGFATFLRLMGNSTHVHVHVQDRSTWIHMRSSELPSSFFKIFILQRLFLSKMFIKGPSTW